MNFHIIVFTSINMYHKSDKSSTLKCLCTILFASLMMPSMPQLCCLKIPSSVITRFIYLFNDLTNNSKMFFVCMQTVFI